MAAVHVDFKGVFFIDVECTTQLDGKDNTTQLIYLAHDACGFDTCYL